jgi:hypothetical protein
VPADQLQPNQIVTAAIAPNPANASRCDLAGTHRASAPKIPMIVPPRIANVAAEIDAVNEASTGTITM